MCIRDRQGVPSYVNIASKAAKYNTLVIRMQQWGCNNRPFYHVVVDKVCHPKRIQIDYKEQVGTYDPMVMVTAYRIVASTSRHIFIHTLPRLSSWSEARRMSLSS